MRFKSVLVTGGAGYVGSLLVPQLLNLGYKVTAYDIMYFGDDFLPKGNPNLKIVNGDIRDAKKLAAECKGIDFWIKNPGKTAEIVAKELSLPLEDATRMMKGTEMVPCSKQLTAQYLGTPEKKGQFADTLLSTADFLVAQKHLPKLLPKSDFEAFLKPEFMEKAIAQ